MLCCCHDSVTVLVGYATRCAAVMTQSLLVMLHAVLASCDSVVPQSSRFFGYTAVVIQSLLLLVILLSRFSHCVCWLYCCRDSVTAFVGYTAVVIQSLRLLVILLS